MLITLRAYLDDFLLRLRGVSLSGLVLGVQILGVLRALHLIDFSSINAALLSVLGALPCFRQRHILHSLVHEDPPPVSWF